MAGSDRGRSGPGSGRCLRGPARPLVLVAGAFVKHLLQIALEGLRTMDGLQQFCPQASRLASPMAAFPPAAPDKVESQHTEEDNREPHSNPQEQGVVAEDRYDRWIVAVLHIAAALGLAQFAAGFKTAEAARPKE